MSHNSTAISVSSDNFDWQRDTIPDFVTLSLYIIIGLVGNTIVILVYKFHLTKASEERYFIPILALADLIACVVSSSLGIVWNYHQENFTNVALCKIVYYFMGNTTYMSIFLLLCIAVQRYLKICRKRTLSLRCRRIMIFICLVCAVCFTIPLCLTYGIVHFKKNGHVITSHCSKLKYSNKIFGALYGIVVSSFIFLVYLSFIFLYGKIGYAIYHHFKTHQFKHTHAHYPKDSTPRNSKPSKSEESYEDRAQSENSETGNNLTFQTFGDTNKGHVRKSSLHDMISDKNMKAKGLQNIAFPDVDLVRFQKIKNTSMTVDFRTVDNGVMTDDQSIDSLQITCPMSDVSSDSLSTTKTYSTTISKPLKKKHRKRKRSRRLMNKFSFMFMIVTTVFLICFIPVSTILTLEGFYPDFWEKLSSSQVNIVIWLYRTFIINNISNPLIYAFMDIEFRNAAKKLFKQCCGTM